MSDCGSPQTGTCSRRRDTDAAPGITWLQRRWPRRTIREILSPRYDKHRRGENRDERSAPYAFSLAGPAKTCKLPNMCRITYATPTNPVIAIAYFFPVKEW